MYFWPVQNIQCRNKGCRSTVSPPEAPTVTSRYLAKANQRTKVLHRCCYTNLTDELTGQQDENLKRGHSTKIACLTQKNQTIWLVSPTNSLLVYFLISLVLVISWKTTGKGWCSFTQNWGIKTLLMESPFKNIDQISVSRCTCSDL